MANPKLENVLYSLIQSRVRNALDLEYAIRASELISHDQMRNLKQLEGEIVDFWTKLGASEEEVRQENLLDFAWDTLQVGFTLTRRHGRIFHPDLLQVLNVGLPLIREEFSSKLHLLDIPAARFYRVCDLLSCSDIPQVISAVRDGLKASNKYTKKDEVPLSEFGVKMREPIHLHPSFRYGIREEGGKTVFGFEVDLAGKFDIFEWRQQLNEFQYQYSLYRGTIAGRHDPITLSLIREMLRGEIDGSQSSADVPGLDSFMPALTGLYCWDRYKRDGRTLVSAFDEAIDFYAVSTDAMRRNYRIAANRIKSLAARFEKAADVTRR
jgi:hypothetical protein